MDRIAEGSARADGSVIADQVFAASAGLKSLPGLINLEPPVFETRLKGEGVASKTWGVFRIHHRDNNAPPMLRERRR